MGQMLNITRPKAPRIASQRKIRHLPAYIAATGVQPQLAVTVHLADKAKQSVQ